MTPTCISMKDSDFFKLVFVENSRTPVSKNPVFQIKLVELSIIDVQFACVLFQSPISFKFVITKLADKMCMTGFGKLAAINK